MEAGTRQVGCPLWLPRPAAEAPRSPSASLLLYFSASLLPGTLSSVRTLLASALVLLACGLTGGCADSSSRPSGAGAPPSIPGGPDAIVLRVSRGGGLLSAYAYPGLDSTLWRSTSRAPALDRVIAFGPEDGYLAAVDTSGAAVRIDLRLGSIASARGESPASVSSADGADVYALNDNGNVSRFTPSGGDWKLDPPLPANAIFAQGDGSVIIAGAEGSRVVVWRVRPPGQSVSDSLSFDVGGEAADVGRTVATTAGMIGDRVYFGANESVIAVRSRDLGKALEVDMGEPVVGIAATPSGDRLFVALADETALRIVDRFEEGVSGKIKLPTVARELRMDPLGRVLLARGDGDTVYVVSLATDEVAGIVRSDWRGDLPLVLPDGAIALARGEDVVFANATTFADGRSVKGGGKDFWHVLRWNGFRPRAAGLDEPVQFRRSAPRDTDAARDSVRRDTAPGSLAPPPSVPTAPATRPAPRTPARDSLFAVQFAAVLDEETAQKLVGRIKVDGQRPRISTAERAGKTLYRVVLGPYSSRDVAERVGKTSGQSYWVFEGTP